MTESTKIPISLATPGISRFLNHIRAAGVPTKVNGSYLKSASFRNSNDSGLITIFKLLGFLDPSGTPTQLWKQYRGDAAQARIILGNAIRVAYKGLFDLYPDAPIRPDEPIANWIRSHTNYGEDSVSRAVRTFKALCAEATFEDEGPVEGLIAQANPRTEDQEDHISPAPEPPASSTPVRHTSRPGITINIELQILPTDDPKVYDNFFAAMKKHLFDEG